MLNAVDGQGETERRTAAPPAPPGPGRATASSVRLTVAGAVCSLFAVLAAGFGLAGFSSLAGPGTRRGWEVVLLASAVAMLALCVAQLVVWRRAYAQWNQGRAPQLTAAGRVSWTVHLASYVVVLAALLSGLGASADAVWTTSSAAWFTGSMVLVVAGQVLGAVQYVRAGGPPGTIPTHVRRLRAWLAEQRRFDDDDLGSND